MGGISLGPEVGHELVPAQATSAGKGEKAQQPETVPMGGGTAEEGALFRRDGRAPEEPKEEHEGELMEGLWTGHGAFTGHP